MRLEIIWDMKQDIIRGYEIGDKVGEELEHYLGFEIGHFNRI